MRLSRPKFGDMDYWRSLALGHGRDLVRLPLYLTVHSDAADVGYDGTLGLEEYAGLWGLCEINSCGATSTASSRLL